MPLSAPTERELLHQRDIVVKGYRRKDGLFDIEAQLTDCRSYLFSNPDRGEIRPGEPLHGMLMRITINEDMLIVAAEAVTEFGPYSTCGGGAESFSRLAGLTIRPGFVKLGNERMVGSTGCTHIRELLQQIATTALQTMFPVRMRKAAENPDPPHVRPRLLDSCYGYASDGHVVARRWPQFYTGPSEAEAKPAAD